MKIETISDEKIAEMLGSVKHGHWERVSREYAAGEGAEMYAKCSKCGSIEVVYTPSYVQRYKYCPYCGAKMDGERREE